MRVQSKPKYKIIPATREGFWHVTRGDKLPRAKKRMLRWRGINKLIRALRSIDRMKKSNHFHLRGSKVCITKYVGVHVCTICGAEAGMYQFRIDGWEWPESLLHYVSEHNVKPSKAFRVHVISLASNVQESKPLK